MPLPDNSVDAVVGTLVLCSVDDVPAALSEVRRILKPGAAFYFIEHVAAPAHSRLRWVQRFVRPFWSYFGDGCQPDRETCLSLEAAGFDRLHYERFRAGSRWNIVGPHIMGSARKT